MHIFAVVFAVFAGKFAFNSNHFYFSCEKHVQTLNLACNIVDANTHLAGPELQRKDIIFVTQLHIRPPRQQLYIFAQVRTAQSLGAKYL